MKKAVILGCENSHADNFLSSIKNNSKFSDIEMVGVYSNEKDAAQALHIKYGVAIMNSFDEAVGKVDGIIITARHGNDHFRFAKPYIESGIPMFIDKPITIDEDEAVRFMRSAKAANVRLTGGSSLRLDPYVIELKNDFRSNHDGNTLGGLLRAPLASDSVYGGFFFYAQHLCEMVLEIYGRYPKAVKAYKAGDQMTVVFRYGRFDVTGIYVEHGYSCYYASRFSENEVKGKKLDLSSSPCFHRELEEFHDLLHGKAMSATYEDFIAPVFVMNAICRSVQNGCEEKIKEVKL